MPQTLTFDQWWDKVEKLLEEERPYDSTDLENLKWRYHVADEDPHMAADAIASANRLAEQEERDD